MQIFFLLKILPDNRTVANVFNNYFQSVIESFDLFEWPDDVQFNIYDIEIIIKKFLSQSSITKSK